MSAAPPLPKPDPHLLASINRLRSNVDFQQLVKHHEALLAHTQHVLVYSNAPETAPLQGRARQLQDFLSLIKGNTP